MQDLAKLCKCQNWVWVLGGLKGGEKIFLFIKMYEILRHYTLETEYTDQPKYNAILELKEIYKNQIVPSYK